MGTTEGMRLTHQKMKDELGEQEYNNLLKKRGAKGGSVKSEAKRLAAKAREAKRKAKKLAAKAREAKKREQREV